MPAISIPHPSASRGPWLRLPVLLFGLALMLVLGAALASLLSLHDPGLAAIIALSGCTGVCGAAVAYAMAGRGEGVEEREQVVPEAIVSVPSPVHVHAQRCVAVPQVRLRIQSLPVADLPPAYLAAVRKGVEANRAALQARASGG
jgi:hypothetical protein